MTCAECLWTQFYGSVPGSVEFSVNGSQKKWTIFNELEELNDRKK
jgi:hypothetical protein